MLGFKCVSGCKDNSDFALKFCAFFFTILSGYQVLMIKNYITLGKKSNSAGCTP